VTRGPAFWGVALLLPVLHFLLHVGLGVGAWAPDLLTVGLLVTARQVRTGTAAGVGFALGLLEDALSILSFGANTMALTLVGILGARSRELFVGESVAFLASYLALGTWLRGAIHWLLTQESPREEAVRVLLVQAPAAAAYAAVVGTLLLLVTGVWTREFGA
jgi:rod shape-determining protein MreD